MRLIEDRDDEEEDGDEEHEADAGGMTMNYRAARESAIRYCQGDPEAARRDGLHEILSDLGYRG